MQQATCAHSGANPVASSGNIDHTTAPSRRALLGFAGAITIAVSSAAVATVQPGWNAVDWLTDWQRLGCGAKLDAFGNPRLTPRSGVEAEASVLLSQVNSGERLAAISATLAKLDNGCPALRAVAQIEQIDRECVSGDDDPAGEQAWLERWSAAYEQLERIPATSGRGLAAKLRQGVEGNGSVEGDHIIASVIRQLERWG